MTATAERDSATGAPAGADPEGRLAPALDLAALELPLIAVRGQLESISERGMPGIEAERFGAVLRRLLDDDEVLRKQAVRAFRGGLRPDPDRQAAETGVLREQLEARVSADQDLQGSLLDVVEGRGPREPSSLPARRHRALAAWWHRRSAGTRTWLQLTLMLSVFVLVLAGPSMVAVVVVDGDLRWTLLRVFGVIALAGFPGFLLARFVFSRARAVWDEFVLNLHRLRIDEPRYLPEPLVASPYHRSWYEDGGPALKWSDSIYERKFRAAYGAVPQNDNATAMLTLSKALPAYLATLVLAVLWTAVLWGAAPLTLPPDDLPTVTALAFAFLGAYAFAIEMLIRRYFQLDLRPIAYNGILARLFFVLVAAYAVHHAFGPRWSSATEAAVLFVVGFFPTTALQLLRVALAGILRKVWLPNLTSDYPLDDLDGMNVWYEARLLEVGIEDMQNLVSANIVDVILNTRVPVARLVDWVDQAILYLHMAPIRGRITSRPADSAEAGHPPSRLAVQARCRLRSHGIRTATDLEHLHDAGIEQLSGLLGDDGGVRAIDSIRASFANEPNLENVKSWKRCTVPAAAGYPTPR
jgi:hypothetical protein